MPNISFEDCDDIRKEAESFLKGRNKSYEDAILQYYLTGNCYLKYNNHKEALRAFTKVLLLIGQLKDPLVIATQKKFFYESLKNINRLMTEERDDKILNDKELIKAITELTRKNEIIGLFKLPFISKITVFNYLTTINTLLKLKENEKIIREKRLRLLTAELQGQLAKFKLKRNEITLLFSILKTDSIKLNEQSRGYGETSSILTFFLKKRQSFFTNSKLLYYLITIIESIDESIGLLQLKIEEELLITFIEELRQLTIKNQLDDKIRPIVDNFITRIEKRLTLGKYSQLENQILTVLNDNFPKSLTSHQLTVAVNGQRTNDQDQPITQKEVKELLKGLVSNGTLLKEIINGSSTYHLNDFSREVEFVLQKIQQLPEMFTLTELLKETSLEVNRLEKILAHLINNDLIIKYKPTLEGTFYRLLM